MRTTPKNRGKLAVEDLKNPQPDDMNLVRDYFLGDPEEIKKLMEAVANQGKK